MTSVMALPCEVEPALEPGLAELEGSLPHATRLKALRAPRTANDAVRDARRFLVMHVLRRRGALGPRWTRQPSATRAVRKSEALAPTFRRTRTYARHVTDWIVLDEQPMNEFPPTGSAPDHCAEPPRQLRTCLIWRPQILVVRRGLAHRSGSGRPTSGKLEVSRQWISGEQLSQACGRCRSRACTSPSDARCATRNSPVTSVVGAMSSASRIWGSTGRCTHLAVGSPVASTAVRSFTISLATARGSSPPTSSVSWLNLSIVSCRAWA